MRRIVYLVCTLIVLAPLLAAVAGFLIGPGIVRPAKLSSERSGQMAELLQRTSASRQDFAVRAPDGVLLQGWKVRPAVPSGDWVLLFHGVSDNRTGMLGAAEMLLRHHFSLVMMDARAHGKSGGDIATYGWKERFDTVAVTHDLCASERVHHLYALGASMGGAIALQSAAVEPRIEAVVAEASFASMREVSYDYAGLWFSPWLGKTLFRPASMVALRQAGQAGQFDPDSVSPQSAVAQRGFPVLLICGTFDRQIPCRHAQLICRAARGPCELWAVQGAEHAAALGKAPREYADRVIRFLEGG